jgi:hypothetical protein
MNEQIKQLELEAIAYADSKVPAMDRYNDIYHSIVRGKFAELIVRECIRVPYDMWDKAELNADVAVKIEHRIKQHFGVEE